MGTAKGSIQRRLPHSVIRKGLAEFLPTSVQKSYFMLSDAERDLLNTETDLAAAVLGYKGVVLDSIVEDRRLAEAAKGRPDQKLVEQLNFDKSQLGQYPGQPARLSRDSSRHFPVGCFLHQSTDRTP